MHDSENGTHSATAAETLVLTNNLVYSETSNYFDVINHHHSYHNNYHHNHHHHHHHHQHLNQNQDQSHDYSDIQYSHDTTSLSNANLSNNNDTSLHQNQSNTLQEDDGTLLAPQSELLQQHAHDEQLMTLPYSQVDSNSSTEPQPHQAPNGTRFIDDIMIDGTSRLNKSDHHDGTEANEFTTLPTPETNTLKNSEELSKSSPISLCNTESKIVTSNLNTSTLAPTSTVSSSQLTSTTIAIQPQHPPPTEQFYTLKNDTTEREVEGTIKSYNLKAELEEDDDDEDDDEDNDDDDDDEDDEEDDDELVEEDEENDDEEEEDEDEDDGDEDDDESEEDSEDIVDPGQHCHLVQEAFESGDLVEHGETVEGETGVLDGERLLEVTRKLVRSTERDPDRDLRKQVLLKTAIKKLPHFMDYNRYSDSLDRGFHNNMSPQAYYEHHDSQQKFYHSVQPNAIQMSTTSLRMLDLNDDHESELNNIEQGQQQDSSLLYNNRSSLDQHDYVDQNQYERYHRTQDINHYETSSPMISRHNSLDNLYQPMNGSDLGEDMKEGDERIPIAFQIACELYDFTCAPDDNDRKLLDNLTNGYYIKPTKEPRTTNTDGGEDGTDTRDQEGSDTSSSSHSSSSDESANSMVSQSTESDEIIGTSLLEASLNSTSEFYHNSHDSGVALFSTRSNKRSSSSIGFDDEMEIDHLTELSTRSPNIGSNSQYKKLRKREILD